MIENKSNYIFRFAPSPTGFLHVGGARTAIFNWLMARKYNGKFLIRIEDTDRARSTKESIEQIFNSLKWFDLFWDDEPVFQSSRLERHIEVVHELLNKTKAYRCFCSKEILQEKRDSGKKENKGYIYDKTCRYLSKEIINQNLKKKIPYSIRIKVPTGITSYVDGVHEQISVNNLEIDDFIILRTDKTPVYQLSVVVDDFDIGVTHVIRGDDHLSNTPKQIIIYAAMNWPVPSFSHLPLILGEDKIRLSKRHGATSVVEFEEQGILPEVLFNYLCLLGWSPGDDREILSRNELVKLFSIQRVNKANSVFDLHKLYWMNGKYLSQLKADKIYNFIKPHLSVGQLELVDADLESFFQLIDLVKERIHTLSEIFEGVQYFFVDPKTYEQKGVKKYFSSSESKVLLELSISATNNSENYQAAELEDIIRNLADSQGVNAGKIIHPLRLALTGRTRSPGLFEVMQILGKERVNHRISNALEFIRNVDNTVKI